MELVPSSQPMLIAKKTLEHHLKTDLHKKSIACSNLAKVAESTKDSVGFWLDEQCPFPGDAISITGSTEPELKLRYTQLLTKQRPDETYDENEFLPRALLVTASCIGAGLGSNNACSVIHLEVLGHKLLPLIGSSSKLLIGEW